MQIGIERTELLAAYFLMVQPSMLVPGLHAMPFTTKYLALFLVSGLQLLLQLVLFWLAFQTFS